MARGADDACWLWTGAVNPTTHYGTVSVRWEGGYFQWSAHRAAWLLAHGPIGAYRTIDHRCGQRLCCNPAHLEPVTPAENARRANVTRWRLLGDGDTCRHGHIGERMQDRSGAWYCRACNREKNRRRRAAGLSG